MNNLEIKNAATPIAAAEKALIPANTQFNTFILNPLYSCDKYKKHWHIFKTYTILASGF